MSNKEIRLNPFVYISETDVRFYLLVFIGIIVPSIEAFFLGTMIFRILDFQITLLLRLLILVPIVLFIPILIYFKYIRYPKKVIEVENLKEFDKQKFFKYWECIEKLCDKYLSNKKQPILMYFLDFGGKDFAITFGTRNHMYIGVFGKLIKKFNENVDSFKSIFLHEIGHIANKDVEKVYLAEATWQSLKSTLSIPLAIFIIFVLIIYLKWKFYELLYFVFAGRDMVIIEDPEMSLLQLQGIQIMIGFIIFCTLFLIIIYVLRNQIIRLREFYADAKVFEWEKSPDKIIKALQEEIEKPATPLNMTNIEKIKKWVFSKLLFKENRGEHYSKIEIAKFHPNIKERIQLLKNNSMLFTSSLWVAFTIGFCYNIILIYSYTFYEQFSDFYWESLGTGIDYQKPSIIIPYALVTIFIFPFLMLAVSSNFHKSILKISFIDKKDKFSTSTILNIIKFSIVFGLGLQIIAILWLPININVVNIENIKSLIFTAFYFSLTLTFLLIFGSMLIKRSFSKKDADKNFLIITVFSSILYIVNRLVTLDPNLSLFEMPPNLSFVIIFFLFYSAITFAIVKIKYKKLLCPSCREKIKIANFQLNCPNCQYNLYSWAIYSF